MRGTLLTAPFEVISEDRPDAQIIEPTDAVVRTSATCVCGSDLWHYRGINPFHGPKSVGHEYCGVVEAVGEDVTAVRPGQFVVGGFTASCGKCPHCLSGVQTACVEKFNYDDCQAELIRVPNADGTLVATPEPPDPALIPSLLTLSDVMSTGWHAATCAGVEAGMTVAVVGDGAVGLCGVLAAAEMGAERVIAMSRHEPRQQLAREFGATDLIAERGDDGVAKIMELTEGVGADAVLECVGTNDSMLQALASARPGATVGYVGVPHGIELPIRQMFNRNVGLRGGMAPARHYLPDLMGRVLAGQINPGRVFDLELPLAEVAEAYRAMDERRAIKVLLRP
ncbi:zinc-dependent alcohol dehydrogenase family protein [Granulicoccus phenolivorans]|uniref:zinc-dependent alcohol dehydrogenase family protein n=1 Tax=Granulicoccus phenolivorans TaxID=266854 RepID=UPI00041B644C|nr:zinc-dependent alcohol dehydrogenase family protein [Granulicoccus phenolivorans]